MKKLLTALILTAALAFPQAAHAESAFSLRSLFPFTPKEKGVPLSTEPTPEAASIETTETLTPETEADASLEVPPLSTPTFFFQRKTVAEELEHIFARLSLATDNTRTTALLLAKNGIDTAAAQTTLAEVALTLAQARISIDMVTASTQGIQSGIFSTSTADFKEQVATAEKELLTVREALFSSLSLLKSAVDTTTPVIQ